MNDHRPREIQLTSKQMVFVFMSTVLVAVVVFLLGVWVGRGIDTGSMAATEDVVSGRPTAPAPADQPGSDGAPPASGEQKQALTYPETLAGGGGSAAAAPNSQAQAPPPTSEPPPASNPPEPAPQATQTPAPPSAPPPPQREKPQPPAPAAERWFVQVGAFSARSGAEKIAAEFKGKGFPVTVTAGPTFRVWIGPYPKKAAAEQVASRVRQEGKDASVIQPR